MLVTRPVAPAQALWWLLRLGAAFCFIGHGAFGLLRKEAWLPYFALVGIGPEAAAALMPLVGTVDIVAGVLLLVRPRPVVAAYMAVWAVWTALLRPLTGEPAWEALERAGNYGVPAALLLLMAFRGRVGDWRSWVRPATARPLEPALAARLRLVLAATAATLLVGHAGLAIGGKALLVEHHAALGLAPAAGAALTPIVGWMQLALAAAILLRPTAGVGILVCAWKVASESLFLVAGAPVWEFVERAGSYAAPLALALLPATRGAGAAARSSLAARLPGLRGVGLPVLLLLTAGLAPRPAAAQGTTAADPARDAAPGVTILSPALGAVELLARLRDGGLVLACRHAITDPEGRDRGPAREQQRNLTAEGAEQARTLGRRVRAAGVPIGGVFTSPMYRTRESAELSFGEVTLSSALRGEPSAERQALFFEPPAAGTNRVLMTHQGVLYGTLPGVARGSIGEGDCVVVRPREREVLGKLAVEEWKQ